jgi:hypothetical protein
MMRHYRLPLAALMLLAATTAFPQSLSSVDGSMVRLEGGFLLVGTKDGAIVGFDPKNDRLLFKIPGTSKAPVKDVVWLNGRPWWITEGSPFLHGCTYDAKPLNVDLSDLELGPIKRLGSWQGMLSIHTDKKLRFMETGTRRIAMAEEVLPKDIAVAAEQGELLTWWEGSRGLAVTLRRYAQRSRPEEPGSLKDVALVNGWNVDANNRSTLLGGYTTSVVGFRESAGPDVEIEMGQTKIRGPHGSADVGNLKLGPEGVIGLQKSGALVIPFYKDNWYPNRLKTPIAPNYAQTTAYSGSTLWWSVGPNLYSTSIEDGSTDSYLTVGAKSPIVSIAADAEGAYILTKNGKVAHIRTTSETRTAPYIRFDVQESAPASLRQSIQRSIVGFNRLPAKQRTTAGLVRQFKISKSRLLRKPVAGVAELQYGDLIKSSGKLAVYVGKGEAVRLQPNSQRVPIETLDVSEVLRILAPTVNIFVTSGNLLDYVPPVGIGNPLLSLGSSEYVSWDVTSRYDRPYNPALRELSTHLDSWIGVPYRWAGSSYDGTDCSGLVTSLYRTIGIALPRHSQHIGRAGFGEIVRGELRFGDVLVMPQPKHCAIYVGGGKIIEAISGGVQYRPVTSYRRAVVRRFVKDREG